MPGADLTLFALILAGIICVGSTLVAISDWIEDHR